MNSIRGRILLSLGVFAIFFVFVTIIVFNFLDKAKSLRDLQGKFASANYLTLSIINKDILLINQESIKSEFYTDPEFLPLKSRNRKYDQLKTEMNAILTHPSLKYFDKKEDVQKLYARIERYDSLQQKILRIQKIRGFKDEGLEGKMREYAHSLENYGKYLEFSDLLSLRRHEKDFFLREDQSYVNKFNRLSSELQRSLIRQNPGQTKVLDLLTKYTELFNEVVATEKLIGNSKAGLIKAVNENQRIVEALFTELMEGVNVQTNQIINRMIRQFSILLIIGFVVSSTLSYLIAHFVSSSIKRLALSMKTAIKSNFKTDVEAPPALAARETKWLYLSYKNLISTIQKQLEELEKKYQELEGQNEELSRINELIKKSEERLKESNAVKNKFFSIISHDLKGPMSTMTLLLNTLFEDIHNFSRNETKSFADNILNSANSISLLLENLLAWSQSQTDRISLHQEVINLYELIHINQQLYSAKMREKNIELSIKSNREIEVFADRNMIDFVIRNLMDNAIKFTPEYGHIFIIVSEFPEEISIAIRDTGIGISEEKLEKLFSTTNSQTEIGTSGEKGTGLGLALSYEFVKRNNGKLKVVSKPEHGTTFTLRLPKKQPSEDIGVVREKQASYN